MVANTTPKFQDGPKVAGQTIENADSTNLKTLFTAGADGALIDNIAVISDDTSAVIITITLNDGTTDFGIGELSIPAGAGTDGSTAAENLLDALKLPYLQAGGGITLGSNHVLKVNAKSAVTATKKVTLVAFGGDY